jgi:hypothetical protein
MKDAPEMPKVYHDVGSIREAMAGMPSAATMNMVEITPAIQIAIDDIIRGDDPKPKKSKKVDD